MSEVEGTAKDPMRRSSPHSRLAPDARSLRPARISISILERLGRCLQRAGVVARLITRHTGPIHRLGRRLGVGSLLHHITELPLGVLKIVVRELGVPQSELQLAEEIVGG